jgi:two-component system chemotaxis sensor kinase CheA
MQEQEMLNELVVESREHLQAIEPDLLDLEHRGNDVSDELINRVFRAVHSIKGGFGFFGITPVVRLSHTMENVMVRVRDKQLPVSPELTDALLVGVDKLRLLLDDIEHCDQVAIDGAIGLLDPFLLVPGENAEASQPREASGISVEDVLKTHKSTSREQLQQAREGGKFLYRINLNAASLSASTQAKSYAELFSAWEQLGAIVDCIPAAVRTDNRAVDNEDVLVVYASVLETELVAEGMGIGGQAIQCIVDTAALLKPTANNSLGAVSQIVNGRGEGGGAEEALRVKVSLLNNLMNYAGELVLARNQLLQLLGRTVAVNAEAERAANVSCEAVRELLQRACAGALPPSQIDESLKTIREQLLGALSFELGDVPGLSGVVQNINMVTTVLQESIMQTRMQPLSVVFNKFPRVIRDLAHRLDKEIRLTQIGQEVELDKSIVEMLSDPLTHLIRNCADHGIEPVLQRQRAGKDPQGEVVLRAYQEGGKVIIEVLDDGRGIDVEAVKRKAVERGVISEERAMEMSAREAQVLIFAPGFSTVEKVSDISGRGVGMDVVKTNIERLGGTVEIDSVLGKSTRITMKLPLTLAIIPSLIVTTANRRFAVPQVGLEEVVRIRAQDVTRKIERVHGSEVLRLRGKLLPLVRLDAALGLVPTFVHPQSGAVMVDKRSRWSDRRGPAGQAVSDEVAEHRSGAPDRREAIVNAVKVVVLRLEKHLYGLVVDDVQDSEEIVVKPLPEFVKGSHCYSGATIMGDGRVAMILDPNGLAQMAGLSFELLENDIAAERKRAELEDVKVLHDMLLFSIGGEEHFAVDLMTIARIEKRRADEVERIGSSEFLTYEDSSLPIIRLESLMPVQPPSEQTQNLFVLVPRMSTHPFGIVTTRVEDTVRTELALDTTSVRGVGIRGSAIIDKKMSVVLDMPALIEHVAAQRG